jgi:hypothetical protein
MLIARVSSWIRDRFGRVEVERPAEVPLPVPIPVQAAPERPSAVAILRNEPSLSASDLADRAGVTLSYARSLIRRQRAKPLTNSLRTALPVQVRELSRRPGEASRREQVLDRSAAGLTPDGIAQQLTIPLGEIEFILKVDRLKKSLKN